MPRIRGNHKPEQQTETENNPITTTTTTTTAENNNNDQDDRKNAAEEEEAQLVHDDKGEGEGESLVAVENVEEGNEDEATEDVIRKWPMKDPAKQHKHEKKSDNLGGKDTNGDGGGDGDGDGHGNDSEQMKDGDLHNSIETDVIYPAELEEEEEEDDVGRTSTGTEEEEFSPPSCPPLFVQVQIQESESSSNFIKAEAEAVLPSFPQRFICNANESIGTHPSLYFTAFLTILFFCYCACSRRNSNNRSRLLFFKRRTTRRGLSLQDSKSRGEYTALDVVYNELLDDFEDEEMSSCLQSQDDDSVGTIISQWSEGGGAGGIELSSFDDDHLSLSEMNG